MPGPGQNRRFGTIPEHVRSTSVSGPPVTRPIWPFRANSSRHPTTTIGTAGLPVSANQEAPPHGRRLAHLSAMNCWLSRTCQRCDDARVIGWPQAGRRPIGWFVADEVDVLHRECTAKQNQVDTVLELRPRIQQFRVLATRGAGPLWVPRVGQSCMDKRLVNLMARVARIVSRGVEVAAEHQWPGGEQDLILQKLARMQQYSGRIWD